MRRVVAALGLLWGLANLLLSYLFVANAFVAKTVMHEGFLAQLALLLAGVTIEVFAVVLIWQCLRMIVAPGVGAN